MRRTATSSSSEAGNIRGACRQLANRYSITDLTFSKPWSKIEQALRSTDLLLQSGGFGAIVLDMGSLTPESASRVPLATWFRIVLQLKERSPAFCC